MKAQILKIAGVKSEKEFYKKFPSEEAFMKKHGEELKKAQYGAFVSGPETPVQKPIAYDDLYQDTMSNITGVSKEEKARQDALASQQAIASSNKSSKGGIGDILGNIDPKMITDLAASFAKNGKKMKKAEEGIGVMGKPFQGMPSTPNSFSVNSNSGFNTNVSQNPYLSGSMIGGQPAQASSGSWAANPYINSPFKASQSTPDAQGFDWQGLAGKVAPILSPVISGVQGIIQDNKDIANANKYAAISDVVAQAAASRPEQSARRYVRPEDNLVENLNPRGKKASIFAKGGMIEGNPTEIQNTYEPGDLYSGLAYEPLNDSNVKQYAYGGDLPKAEGGINLDPFSGVAGGLGGAIGSATGHGTGKGGNAAAIGSAIGGVAGSFIPIPGVGTALGSLAGGFIGGLFDADTQNKKQEAQDKLQANINSATMSNGARSLQMQNKGFMEDGGHVSDFGYMSDTWNPQVITKFGDLDVSQVHTFAEDGMPQYRAGGHLKEYTPPSASAMYTGRDLPYQMEDGGQMAMGGDLRVHRGEAETMSYNPFLPDGGETVMFRGPSHDNGGMPISFGQNGVEVEGGEPAIKMKEGGQDDNLVVYGNMVIPNYGAAEIGDEKAKGKKFKHYVADLSKVEAKQNKIAEKSAKLANDTDATNPFDQLTLNSAQANILGTTMKLKDIADKKMNAAAVQNAILDTASEHGLESDALAKGKIKYAKANDPYAEFGTKLEKAKPGKDVKKTAPSPLQSFIKSIPYSERKAMAVANGIKDFKGTADQNKKLLDITSESANTPLMAPGTGVLTSGMNPAPTPFNLLDGLTPQPVKSYPMMSSFAPDRTVGIKSMGTREFPLLSNSTDSKDNEDWWNTGMTALSSIVPHIRPTNQIPLDPSQLQGEMYAMANNQEEPVYAQSYQPMLTQTSNISLQDQLNEITSQSRAAERMAQGNPAALAMIASQAQEAKNKVLGEQFRLNQGEQQRVGEANRQTINEANRFNLGLYDQQQQRQAQAKSNTKAQTIAALNSISDKIAKNKLENRQLGISENLYNYRFTPNGVAYNLNGPANFAPYGSGDTSSKATGQLDTGKDFSYNKAGKIIGVHSIKDDESKSRNGKKVNGSIVKAIKNL